MLAFTDEQRAALIKMRQDWQAAEQARDALDRAKLPLSSSGFDVLPSHGLPKGLDDRLTRIEALQAALERAVRQAAESLSLTDEALKMDEIGIPEFRFFLCLLQTRRDAGGSGKGGEYHHAEGAKAAKPRRVFSG